MYGNTVKELSDLHSKASWRVFQHTKYASYSMLELPVLNNLHLYPLRRHYILYGFITEGCVRHTCLELLERGGIVHVLADGVGSIFPHEREVALISMRDSGAHITSSESIFKELTNERDIS